jgi:hypothetical protein
VTLESYWKDGHQHRDGDQPAVIKRDATTGNVIQEEYWNKGNQIPAPAKRPVHWTAAKMSTTAKPI